MDVIKVFTEEPAELEALAPDLDPDARGRAAPERSLEALLSLPNAAYARAYLAGTVLGPERRVGLTALRDPAAWTHPLRAWAGGREWSAAVGGPRQKLPAEDVARVLHRPGAHGPVAALAIGPVPPGALAEVVGDRREHVGALRALLDAGCAVLFPEPAHDGHDWSLFAPAPLAAPLVRAFRQRPGTARCLTAPIRRVRGEHRFYLEQWALDALPEGVEEI